MKNNKEKLLKYLKAHDLMILATHNSRPNAATVYYGIDDDFTIYIVTPTVTEHGKNMVTNHQVACVITDTNQHMYETKHRIGLQIQGTAHEITDLKEMKEALLIWSKNREDLVEKYIVNITNNTWQSRPYVIKPKEIKWFNEELYGKEGIETFNFSK